MSDSRRMVVVSNRLPVVLKRMADGRWGAEPGSGGLVTALTPVLRQRRGLWIGWPGFPAEPGVCIEDALAAAGAKMGMAFEPLPLTRQEIGGFYHGFSNEILWPLFHDLVATGNFDSTYWGIYRAVNEKAARLVSESVDRDDFIWVQDYHFLTAARELRRRGVRNRLGFFLHTPFPAPDMFLRLPWRRQILDGLLEYDLVGFQCSRDLRNFLQCVLALDAAAVQEENGHLATLRPPRRPSRAGSSHATLRVGSFPISIDSDGFGTLAESESVGRLAARLASEIGTSTILLGVDRLDYTKGLPHKIRAFRRALECYPELRQSVTLVQHVVPSRESVALYRDLRLEIERLVGEVNGQFGTPGWTPIRYFYHMMKREELSAYYRLADVLLVTSLKDGMNLVSKEYCASSIDASGVLILSEFAGSASELREGALLVNPYDADGLARAIQAAVSMPWAERRRRMERLRSIVRRHDVFQWVDSYLEAAEAPEFFPEPGLPSFIPEVTTVPSA